MAVATHVAGFDSLAGLAPGIGFHAIFLFIGMVLISVSQKRAKTLQLSVSEMR